MEDRLMKHIDLLVERYPSLESAKEDIIAAYEVLEESYKTAVSCWLPEMAVLLRMRNTLWVS